MTKFYKYINEGNPYGESRLKSISEKDAIELIQKNCQKALKADRIWRGTNFSNDYAYGNSEKATKIRLSKNTNNYYTLVMDNHPSWKKYPKRSKSFICSTSLMMAGGFGTNIFFALPYDNTKIGVCPSDDIWGAFDLPVKIFNYLISKTALDINIQGVSSLMETDYKHLLKSLVIVGNAWRIEPDKWKKLFPFDDDRYHIIDKFINQKKSLDKYFIDFLDPNKNKFSLKNIGDSLPNNKEVWFSGEAIFVDYRINDDIKKIIWETGE